MFISLPYLWFDPLGRLAEYWTDVGQDHPHSSVNLFRGEAFSSAALPWDYALRWFAISQPPVTLLLGLLGLVALGLAVWSSVRRGAGAGPGRGLGGGASCASASCSQLALRCPWLPLRCCGPNTYENWRHFYFLHGPFCLLATFALMGMRQLSVRGLRKRWLGGAAGALTAAGLFVVRH